MRFDRVIYSSVLLQVSTFVPAGLPFLSLRMPWACPALRDLNVKPNLQSEKKVC